MPKEISYWLSTVDQDSFLTEARFFLPRHGIVTVSSVRGLFLIVIVTETQLVSFST